MTQQLTTHTFEKPEWFSWSSSLVVFLTICVAFVMQSRVSHSITKDIHETNSARVCQCVHPDR